ncbi:MAG: hypothetical protein ABIV51_13395 [Saprospiraceae bacterium]
MIFQTRRINPIVALLILVGAIWAGYLVLKGLYALLSIIAIPLLIITAIVDHRIIVNYCRSIITDLQRNTTFGVVKILFTAFGFPLVAGWLFFKAMAKMGLRGQNAPEQLSRTEFSEFEEVHDIEEDLSSLDINEMPKAPREKLLRPDQEPPQDINHYEKLFEANK